MIESLKDHEQLIEGLMHPEAWSSGNEKPLSISTHISTVILFGQHAYKIKKPLDLGFLDYSSLDKRHHFCEEEVRLNQRLAPNLYEAAVPVTGSLEAPVIGGDGPAIEWAVKMQRFDPNAILSQRIGDLNRGLVERIARIVAKFHLQANSCEEDLPYGNSSAVYGPMVQNFSQIRAERPGTRSSIDELSNWTENRFSELQHLLDQRKAHGHIRECHGDLHLGNIALINGQPIIFDGIEFNRGLHWVDTISEVAFLTMDLTRIGRADLARWFLNEYLEQTGDYDALPLLHFYEVYRAMVRAKVNVIHGNQWHHSRAAREQTMSEYRRCLRTAEAFTRPALSGLIITKGPAASGKSTLSGSLLGKLPAIRVRSDVERKRLSGVSIDADAADSFNAGIYSADMTERTYVRLAALAEEIIKSGFIAIVDATFLKRDYRQRFSDLAQSLNVPFVILNCEVPVEELKARLIQRQAQGSDVSDATIEVLVSQFDQTEPLSGEEAANSLVVRPDVELEMDDLVQRLV